jgi:glycosyltransferase involved in cell wall biosynthesis
MDFLPDVVVSANTPLAAQAALLSTSRRIGARFVFWLQDLLGIGIRKNVKKKLSVFGGVVGHYFMCMEKSLLAKSDAVVAITEDFVPIVARAGVPRGKIHVIYNWAPLHEVSVMQKNNEWSREHLLDKTFNFVYSGTLGMKHNPGLLLELARVVKQQAHVRVVVISEGLGADFLAEQKRKLDLDNIVLISYQPFEDLPMVLAAADVLIAILEPDAGVFSVPSKVLTYLCTERALLLALPTENLAARIVEKAGAGIVVSPNDTAAFLNAAATLGNNSVLRKTLAVNGLEYALTMFDIEKITDRFEGIFRSL